MKRSWNFNTLQYTVDTHILSSSSTITHCNTLNTLQHTMDAHILRTTHLLWHTVTRYNTLQHTATHCNTLQHTATHCNTLQHTATHFNILWMRTIWITSPLRHTASHCNTLQHTVTHCGCTHSKSPIHSDTFHVMQISLSHGLDIFCVILDTGKPCIHLWSFLTLRRAWKPVLRFFCWLGLVKNLSDALLFLFYLILGSVSLRDVRIQKLASRISQLSRRENGSIFLNTKILSYPPFRLV